VVHAGNQPVVQRKSNTSEKIKMKRYLVLLAALTLLSLPTLTSADTLTFSPTATASNTNSTTNNPSHTNYQGGANQFDLDHHLAYTWRIGGVTIAPGQVITGARITFHNIANWDTNPNMLFVHLLDTARSFTSPNSGGTRSATVNGVTWFQDASGTPVNDISDYFAGDDSALVAAGTGDTYLFSHSFNMVGQAGYVATDFTYNFSTANLATLAQYILNGGNLAFGIDPDCHYWNNGIDFTITTGPASTPEPTSVALLATGLSSIGFYLRRRRSNKAIA